MDPICHMTESPVTPYHLQDNDFLFQDQIESEVEEHDSTQKKSFAEYSEMGNVPRSIDNIGNTCYQNAVLQTLISISEFNEFCLDPDVLESFKDGQHYEWLESLIELVRQYHFVNDEEFQSAYGDYLDKICKATDLTPFEQEDASELLTLIIDNLTDYFVGYPQYLLEKESLYPEIHPWRSSLNILEGHANFFAGTVDNPRKMSQQIQNNHHLLFPLEKHMNQSIVTLTTLISEYKELELEQRPSTDQSRLVVHKITNHSILQLNKYVFIRLGREHFDKTTSMASRINTRVHMPYFYNFRDLLNQDVSYSATSNHGYRLIAIIHHMGPWLSAGHYTADVFRDGRWYHCDDDHVVPLSEIQIENLELSSTGYIYLYQRLDNLSTETAQKFEPISQGFKYRDRNHLDFVTESQCYQSQTESSRGYQFVPRNESEQSVSRVESQHSGIVDSVQSQTESRSHQLRIGSNDFSSSKIPAKISDEMSPEFMKKFEHFFPVNASNNNEIFDDDFSDPSDI